MATLFSQPSPDAIGGHAGVELVTRSGFRLTVRAARPDDGPLLEQLFERLTPEDRRFRFLSAIDHVGAGRLAPMLSADHRHAETWLAFAEGGTRPVATAMLAADPQLACGEVATSIDRDHKGRGIGWTLLDHVARAARAMGIGRLQSIEDRDNHAAIELEREMGFTARDCPDDPMLVIVEVVLEPDRARA